MNKFGFMKVACAVTKLKVANPRYNKEEIKRMISAADENGTEILVMPELSLCGYTCADLFNSSTLIRECESALSELVSFSTKHRLAFVVGMPVGCGCAVYNCAVMVQGGKILGVTPKEYLANSGEFYEKRWFSPFDSSVDGEVTLCGLSVPFGRLLYNFGSAVVGIEICQDLWVPAPPSEFLALAGANLILNLSASNESVSKNEYRRSLVVSQSARCVCGYAFVSSGVHESTTDLVFGGASYIAENGTLLSESRRFCREGSIIYACVDIERLDGRRRSDTGFSENAKNHAGKYRVIAATPCELSDKHFTREFAPHPFVPVDEDKRSERCEEILNIQTAALAGRLSKTGITKTVVGVSGGLDSTLALLVAARTAKLLGLPESSVLGITLPGFGTTGRTRGNAEKLIRALGAEFAEIDITKACLTHFADIGHDTETHDITYENVQARERTQILMDISNKRGALLVGTGDLSELALGWCTYNGDHMSMYGVNAGIPKTLIRYIVGYLASEYGGEIGALLEDILATPVSPELLPPDSEGKIAQKTEDCIGPYELHDFYLYSFLRIGASYEKTLFMARKAFSGVYDDTAVEKWLKVFVKRFFASQFKRSCVPDSPKVGTIALSPRGDWRMPSDADASIWLG